MRLTSSTRAFEPSCSSPELYVRGFYFALTSLPEMATSDTSETTQLSLLGCLVDWVVVSDLPELAYDAVCAVF